MSEAKIFNYTVVRDLFNDSKWDESGLKLSGRKFKYVTVKRVSYEDPTDVDGMFLVKCTLVEGYMTHFQFETDVALDTKFELMPGSLSSTVTFEVFENSVANVPTPQTTLTGNLAITLEFS